jgi:hypothetical protein
MRNTLSDDQRFPIFVLGFRILEGPDDIVRQVDWLFVR